MAASQHVQHMHKALTQMNLQIHHVISDITGVTGLAIVDAILAGQRDAAELAKLRDPHIKVDAETICKSLVGNWRPRASVHAQTIAGIVSDLSATDRRL
jgi:transposase